MRNQRDLAEEYDRFLKEQPPHLSEDQRARILALSSDLPTLWNAPETTAADRKEIIRLVVDRVVVHVRADSECAEAAIWWRGGVTTRHEIVRPRKLLSRCELTHGRIGTRQLDRHEWWLPDLARALQMPVDKLRIWAIRGWVRSRQVPPRGLWVVWADGRERRRLWKLMADSRSSKSAEQTSS